MESCQSGRLCRSRKAVRWKPSAVRIRHSPPDKNTTRFGGIFNKNSVRMLCFWIFRHNLGTNYINLKKKRMDAFFVSNIWLFICFFIKFILNFFYKFLIICYSIFMNFLLFFIKFLIFLFFSLIFINFLNIFKNFSIFFQILIRFFG